MLVILIKCDHFHMLYLLRLRIYFVCGAFDSFQMILNQNIRLKTYKNVFYLICCPVSWELKISKLKGKVICS